MNTHPLLELHDRFCRERLVLNYRPSTISWWRTAFRLCLNHLNSEHIRTLNDLTSERLRTYLYDKRLAGWTADTFNNQYRALKGFLKWCVERSYLDANPLDGIERPRLEKKLPKRISRGDAELVLEHAFHTRYPYRFLRYRNRAVLAVMLFAGLRASEVLSLRLGDVDLDSRTIFVRCGKGAKDRMVPMSATLAVYLTEYLEDRNRLAKAGLHLFTSLRGDGRFTYGGLKRMVDKVKRSSGVSFSPHRLRHTFATLMLEGGCDLFSLQKMLGHSDIQTTTIYLSASAQMLQAQIAKHPMDQQTIGRVPPAPLPTHRPRKLEDFPRYPLL
jgi:site-specific recombinase XerD